MKLVPEGGGVWKVWDGDREVSRYRWEEMRFSVSWKACLRRGCAGGPTTSLGWTSTAILNSRREAQRAPDPAGIGSCALIRMTDQG